MKFFAAALLFFGAASSLAQSPEVPHKMQFAGMTLTIKDDARKEIQKDVDALTMHGRYYTIKAERAKTYFPIIEKIFEEENLPDDFKYLVLQESALVSDAVSVSNAVGFWQFKDFTAVSMGMRVDKDVDERMNIVSSTHGAAKYLKQNNYYFNNWIYALQSYQMGAGGVQRSVNDFHNGARQMDITSDTYWYVKKFLAHKVAFSTLPASDAQVKVVPYQTKSMKSLKQIASEVSADESALREYNKWLKTDVVPVDKEYVLLVPVGKLDVDFNKLVLASSKAGKANASAVAASAPVEHIEINGIDAVKGRSGETMTVLAARSKISLTSFLKYNDVAIDHTSATGDVYLLAKKKNKSADDFYKVKAGDNLWSVSQHSGVKLRRLKRYNDLSENDKLAPGALIALNGSTHDGKPKVIELQPDEDVAQLNEKETFDWYLKAPRPVETAPIVKETVQETQVVNVPVIVTTKPDTHIVVQGESYTAIARTYGLSVADLLARNNLTSDSPLKPGQVLRITGEMPASAVTQESAGTTPAPGQVHIVKASDTLFGIARQYGVTIKDLMEWNDKKDFNLTVGEKLKIVQK